MLLVLLLACARRSAATERDATVRLSVRAARGAPKEAGDSAQDVSDVLHRGKAAPNLALAVPGQTPDLELWIINRSVSSVGVLAGSEAGPRYRVHAMVVAGDRKQAVSGASVSWNEAATELVHQVAAMAEEDHHFFLRRRPDWPDLGFAFERLTKERKQQFGARDGEVVVTEVAAQGPARTAGLEVGDVIRRLGDKKLDGPGALARAIYAGPPGTVLRLAVDRRGAHPTVALTVP